VYSSGSDFADLVRAIRLLNANEDDVSRRAIAEVLGIDFSWHQTKEPVGTPHEGGEDSTAGTAAERRPEGLPHTNQIPAAIRVLEESQPSVFMSYVRSEAALLAAQLSGALGAIGINTFIDSSSDSPGVNFMETLARRLRDKSSVLILIESASVYTSRWILAEVDAAKGQQLGIIALQMPDRGEPRPPFIDSEPSLKLAESDFLATPSIASGAEDSVRQWGALTEAALSRVVAWIKSAHDRSVAVRSNQPAWLSSATPLPRSAGKSRVIPAKPSLLRPVWTRALLVGAVATICESGEIDQEKLVNELSTGEAIDSLPLIRVATLARGVHCWIDEGEAMQPFIQDQKQLLAALFNVAGASRVTVKSFRGVPNRDGSFVTGAPHLVLSDLGAIDVPEEYSPERATPAEWIGFGQWISSDLQSRVIALSPLPIQSYVSDLRRAITVLCWDRGTSLQTVRRAMAGAA
jgi:hypothetical protein